MNRPYDNDTMGATRGMQEKVLMKTLIAVYNKMNGDRSPNLMGTKHFLENLYRGFGLSFDKTKLGVDFDALKQQLVADLTAECFDDDEQGANMTKWIRDISEKNRNPIITKDSLKPVAMNYLDNYATLLISYIMDTPLNGTRVNDSEPWAGVSKSCYTEDGENLPQLLENFLSTDQFLRLWGNDSTWESSLERAKSIAAYLNEWKCKCDLEAMKSM